MWLCRVLRQSESVLMSVYWLHPPVKNSLLGCSYEYLRTYKPTHTHRFRFLWVFQSSFPRASACQTCSRSLDVKCTAALILSPSQFHSKIKYAHSEIGAHDCSLEGKTHNWILVLPQYPVFPSSYVQVCFTNQPPSSNTWLSKCFYCWPINIKQQFFLAGFH